MSTYYVDYVGGNNGNTGLSFAQRKKTLDSAFTAASAGDTIRVMTSGLPTSLGQSATWTNASATVTLTSAVTQMIADCETNWTASSNVTCTSNTTNFKENTKSQQIAIAAGFTTGLAAYFATGTLDLSSYQQVSFWLRCNATLAGCKNLSLRLCSDTAGVTTVNTINLPDLTGTALNQWVPVTVNTGGALGSSIKSIALYVDTDNGATTILLDNICACKAASSADALSLTSLLGFSDSTGAGGLDYETWYGIASINGTTIKLDNGVNTNAGAGRGWSGRAVAITSSTNANPSVITAANHGLATGDTITIAGHQINTAINGTGLTVTRIDADTFSVGVAGNGVGGATGAFWATTISRTTWKRETTKTTMVAAAGTDVQTATNSGSAGNLITVSGGWNTSDMTSQVDETWYDGQIGLGIGFDFLNTSYNSLSKLAFTRYGSSGVFLGASASNITLNTPGCNNCSLSGFNITAGATACTLTLKAINNNSSSGISNAPTNSIMTLTAANNNLSAGGSCGANSTVTVQSACNNVSTGFGSGASSSVSIVGLIGNTGNGGLIPPSNPPSITTVTLSANNTNGVIGGSESWLNINATGNTTADMNAPTSVKLKNSYLSSSTKATFTTFANGRIFSFDDQGVVGTFHIYCDGGDIATDTSTVHTSGTSWKFSPTSTNRSSSYKLENTLARFTCVAGRTYTVKAWVRRDSVTTLNAGLVVKGGQLNGVPSDVSVTASGSVNTWAQETLATFTPTESGVIELRGQCWDGTGTTSNAWFDDVTVNDGINTYSITLDYLDWRFGPGPDPLTSGSSGMLYHTGGG